ncbi:hypothetical protein [Saccharopolyspora taberi]|uniref:Heme exporter protein D n=1 Tax=Saccharopolyspora taberi TaxID=60895 RepID=A0ABN3VMR9_9PSEU
MSPFYMFALAVLLGFQSGWIVMWSHYRRRIADLEREREWERMRRLAQV